MSTLPNSHERIKGNTDTPDKEVNLSEMTLLMALLMALMPTFNYLILISSVQVDKNYPAKSILPFKSNLRIFWFLV